MSDATVPADGSQSATPDVWSETLPSAGLCDRPWCAEHEMTFYKHDVMNPELIHSRSLRISDGPRSTWGYITTHSDETAGAGIFLSLPDAERGELWSSSDVRRFAAFLLDAADDLDAATALEATQSG